MSIELYRIDDRLIHGQVVVGWAQPMRAQFIMLVDDELAGSKWEQDLYRMGAPKDVEVIFASVADAASLMGALQKDSRRGILLTPDVRTMLRLHDSAPTFSEVNLGGIHTAPRRVPCLRYVFLSSDDAADLRELASRGVRVTAQDVPACSPTPLADLLSQLEMSR